MTLTSGEIIVAGHRINDVPIYKRNIGLVFQNYALFPHKSVEDNIAFGNFSDSAGLHPLSGTR